MQRQRCAAAVMQRCGGKATTAKTTHVVRHCGDRVVVAAAVITVTIARRWHSPTDR